MGNQVRTELAQYNNTSLYKNVYKMGSVRKMREERANHKIQQSQLKDNKTITK